MSNTYYYFVASLPMLDLNVKPLISAEDFLSACGQQLSNQDFQMVRQLLTCANPLENLSPNATFHALCEWGEKFGNELACYRAKQYRKEPREVMRGEQRRDPMLEEAIQQAAKAVNPLEGERILDKARWTLLDHLAVGHHFDTDWILIYGLKLKILEKHQQIASDEGVKRLEEFQKIKNAKE